jgi:hypothetical protein
MDYREIYLAADSDIIKEEVIRSHNYTFYSYKKPVHSGHANKIQYTDILDELILLSSCRKFVVTETSTFSVIAAALSGKLPFLVGKNKSCSLPKKFQYLIVC